MDDNNKKITPLHVMLGSGESFIIRKNEKDEKRYKVIPLLLEDVDEFAKNISIENGMINIIDEERKKNIDEWLSRYVLDSNDQPMSLEKTKEDRWNVVDLKKCLRKICDVSG